MTLLSRLTASAIKTGLRAAFKLPGTLPLPLSLLRRGMAQGRHGLRIRREAGISSDSTGGVPGLKADLDRLFTQLGCVHFACLALLPPRPGDASAAKWSKVT